MTRSGRAGQRGLLFLGLATLLLLACDPDEGRNTKLANELPETHLSLGYFRAGTDTPDTLDQSTARVGMAWWGADADGAIAGYEYRWSYEADTVWHETQSEADTFVVLLTAQEDTFSFSVRAIDDEGERDPSPARVVLPVRNSRPELEWTPNSLELLNGFFGGDTSTTFPHLTFRYSAWDLDGVETIRKIFWALDDTTQWQELDSLNKSLSQVPLGPDLLTPGPHRFFLKAQDVALAESNILSYPAGETDTSLVGVERVWMVREPVGDLLVVYDDPVSSSTRQGIVRQVLENLDLEEGVDYSEWIVNSNHYHWLDRNPDWSEFYWLPANGSDTYNTLSDFDMVFWISSKETQLNAACPPLGQYMAEGGKVLMASADVGYYDDTNEVPVLNEGICLPIDSLTHERARIFPAGGSRDEPLTPGAGFENLYPVLYVTSPTTFQGPGNNSLDFGFRPAPGAEELYYIPEDPGNPVAGPRVTMGCRIAADERPDKARLVYMTVRLDLLDNLEGFFQVLIEEDFDW